MSYYIAIISVLVVVIIFLVYISVSNKGWNCTENGCVYVSDGTFSSKDKCNSYCKSSSNQVSNNDTTTKPILQTAYAYNPNLYNPYNPYSPPYGYYHPSFYHTWNRRDQYKNRDSGVINNHNDNHIVINTPSTMNSPTTAPYLGVNSINSQTTAPYSEVNNNINSPTTAPYLSPTTAPYSTNIDTLFPN
jgi:hypothetical protein